MGDSLEMVQLGQDRVATPQKTHHTQQQPTAPPNKTTITTTPTRSFLRLPRGLKCPLPSCPCLHTHRAKDKDKGTCRKRGTSWSMRRLGRRKENGTSGGGGDVTWDVSVRWDKMRKETLKKEGVVSRQDSMRRETKTKGPMVKEFDVCYKVLLIGDSGVGKTALVRALSGKDFQPKSLTTVGMDFVSTIVEVDGARVKLQIWDTAGQERFRSMTRFQFRGTQGAILAYDISDRESFKTLEYWLKMIDSEIDQHNKEPIPVYLIGNKSDINKRQVSYKQAKQLAEEHLMRGYVETSAKTGRNVCEAFTQLGQAIIEINHPKLMDSYLDKFDREDKYEQKKKEAEALAQYQLQKRRSRIRLPSNISRAKSLEKRAQKCCTS